MKKITFLELLLLSLMTISISMSIFGSNIAFKTLHFQVDMRNVLEEVQDSFPFTLKSHRNQLKLIERQIKK